MSHADYFDEKIQAAVACVVGGLVSHWQNLNPHEPELQADLAFWGDEFLEYVRLHTPIPKQSFAKDGTGYGGSLEIAVVIPRGADS